MTTTTRNNLSSDFIKSLTTQPGVYQMLNARGNVLYVGKARNIKRRVASYFSSKPQDTKTQALMKHVVDLHITVTHSENEALLLECQLIKKHKPHYNVLFRDDKSYPYIVISSEKPYPSIHFYRGQRKKNGQYFGPYPNVSAVRETIHLVQKVFGLRTANDRYDSHRSRPCLKYQIGLCAGACAGLISEEDYDQRVQHAILFLKGKNTDVVRALESQMKSASDALHYEQAAKCRDQITLFREIQMKQSISVEVGDADVIVLANTANIFCIQLLVIRGGRIIGSQAHYPMVPLHSTQDEILTAFITQHYLYVSDETDKIPKEIILEKIVSDKVVLQALLCERKQENVKFIIPERGQRKQWLDMANASAVQSVAMRVQHDVRRDAGFRALSDLLVRETVERIECVDISHTQGESTVASCVVFSSQGAQKNHYRRFNIVGVTPGDDVAAIRQVVKRRYKALFEKDPALRPDVVLIDGGALQLSAARAVFSELGLLDIVLMGVAKGAARKPGLETLHINDQSPIQLPSDSPALHLIQQVRDEAHRFAITGHRRARDKKRVTSVLEGIVGVGKKRRQALLSHFSGIQGIKHATLEELERVAGSLLAKRLFDVLHDESV